MRVGRRMVGRNDERTVRRTDRWTDERAKEPTNGPTDEQIAGRTDGRMDRRRDIYKHWPEYQRDYLALRTNIFRSMGYNPTDYELKVNLKIVKYLSTLTLINLNIYQLLIFLIFWRKKTEIIKNQSIILSIFVSLVENFLIYWLIDVWSIDWFSVNWLIFTGDERGGGYW